MQEAKTNKVRFLHIPKTGGSSFFDCLTRIYEGEHFIFSGNTSKDLERYRKLDDSTRKKIVLIAGHAPMVTGEEEIDCLPTITFLREPVSRVMSFCQHAKEGKSDYLLAQFPPECFDLDEFLNSGSSDLENLQTRMLLGQENYELNSQEQTSIVERAIDVLANKILYFGILEYFDESLMLFRRQFKWLRTDYIKSNEKNSSDLLVFNDRQIDKIRELNAIDLLVYDAALTLFRERLDNNLSYVQLNLLAFRWQQKLSRVFPGKYQDKKHYDANRFS